MKIIVQILLFAILFMGSACNAQKNDKKVVNYIYVGTPKEGSKNGLQQSFFPNGQLKNEGNYINGKREGLYKEWDKEGFLASEGFYENDKANGMMKWYHGTDHLAAYGNMKDGIREGDWKICGLSKDDFCIDAHFENGIRSGLWKIYYNNGILWKEQTWENDKPVSEKCWDQKSGSIKCTNLVIQGD